MIVTPDVYVGAIIFSFRNIEYRVERTVVCLFFCQALERQKRVKITRAEKTPSYGLFWATT